MSVIHTAKTPQTLINKKINISPQNKFDKLFYNTGKQEAVDDTDEYVL